MQEQLMMNKPATRVRKKKFEGQPKRPPRNGYQLFNSIQMLKLTHLSHSEKFKVSGGEDALMQYYLIKAWLCVGS